MNLYADTVAEFGRRLGLPSLRPGRSGGVELDIEKIGRLQLEETEDAVLVTLARPWPPHSERAALTALAQCHWRENHPWPVNAGAKGEEWLTFSARVPMRDFGVPVLDRLLENLTRLHEAVERAG